MESSQQNATVAADTNNATSSSSSIKSSLLHQHDHDRTSSSPSSPLTQPLSLHHFLSYNHHPHTPLLITQTLIRLTMTSLDISLPYFHDMALGARFLSYGTLAYASGKLMGGVLVDRYLGGIGNMRLMMIVGAICFSGFYMSMGEYLVSSKHTEGGITATTATTTAQPESQIGTAPLKLYLGMLSWLIYRFLVASSWPSITKIIPKSHAAYFSWLGMASRIGTVMGMILLGGFVVQSVGIWGVWGAGAASMALWGVYLVYRRDIKDLDQQMQKEEKHPISTRDSADSPASEKVQDLSALSHNVSSSTKDSTEKNLASSTHSRRQRRTTTAQSSSQQPEDNNNNDDDELHLKVNSGKSSQQHPLNGKSTSEAIQYFLLSPRMYQVALFMACTTILTELQSHLPVMLMEQFDLEASKASMTSAFYAAGYVVYIFVAGFLYPPLSQTRKAWYLFLHYAMATLGLFCFAVLDLHFVSVAMILIFMMAGFAPAYYLPYAPFCLHFGGQYSATLMGLMDTISFSCSFVLHAYLRQFASVYGWTRALSVLFGVASVGLISLGTYVFSEETEI